MLKALGKDGGKSLLDLKLQINTEDINAIKSVAQEAKKTGDTLKDAFDISAIQGKIVKEVVDLNHKLEETGRTIKTLDGGLDRVYKIDPDGNIKRTTEEILNVNKQFKNSLTDITNLYNGLSLSERKRTENIRATVDIINEEIKSNKYEEDQLKQLYSLRERFEKLEQASIQNKKKDQIETDKQIQLNQQYFNSLLNVNEAKLKAQQKTPTAKESASAFSSFFGESDSLYKQQEASIKKIFQLKTQMLKVDTNTATLIKGLMQDEGRKYAEIRKQINQKDLLLKNDEKEKQLLNEKIQLQQKYNIEFSKLANKKGIDPSTGLPFTGSTSSMQAQGFGFFDRMAVSMQYALAGMTLMQIRKSVQEIFTTIENVEKQERVLVAVTGESLENVRQYTKEAMDIAKNSATSLENVTLAYERLAKAGIRKEDLKGMAEIVTRFQPFLLSPSIS